MQVSSNTLKELLTKLTKPIKICKDHPADPNKILFKLQTLNDHLQAEQGM
jgi:hypothetical protein